VRIKQAQGSILTTKGIAPEEQNRFGGHRRVNHSTAISRKSLGMRQLWSQARKSRPQQHTKSWSWSWSLNTALGPMGGGHLGRDPRWGSSGKLRAGGTLRPWRSRTNRSWSCFSPASGLIVVASSQSVLLCLVEAQIGMHKCVAINAGWSSFSHVVVQ